MGTQVIKFQLPIPPSVNALFYNRRDGAKGRGRGITKVYRNWKRDADGWFYVQGLHKADPITGKCSLVITLPKTRLDASNAIKAVEDWCVSRKLTSDDKNNTSVSISVDPTLPPRFCLIELRAA